MSYYDFTKAHSQPLVQNLQLSQQSYQFNQSEQNPQNLQGDMMLQHNSTGVQSNLMGISQQYPQHLQQPMLPSVLQYANEDSEGSSSNVQSNRKQSMFGADDEGSSMSSSDNGKVAKSSTGPKRKRKPLIKGSDEYKRRRERNNEAVKKSRIKSKEKTSETQQKVDLLASENRELQEKVSALSKEFDLLKDLYQTHTKTTNEPQDIDLSSLLEPSND